MKKGKLPRVQNLRNPEYEISPILILRVKYDVMMKMWIKDRFGVPGQKEANNEVTMRSAVRFEQLSIGL